MPFRRRGRKKGDAEIAWWLEHWDPVIRNGGLYPGDVSQFLGGAGPAATYEERRWQIARAEVARVLHEAAIDDAGFFAGKVVVDIGPGAVGFPDACPARVSIGVDPLARRYADAGLLLDSDAIYLSVGAEAIPLLDNAADVVLARNSLDHVEDPLVVVDEIKRILRPGGTAILNFDVEHAPSPTEPHALELAEVKRWLAPLRIVHEDVWDRSHGGDGHAVVLRAEAA